MNFDVAWQYLPQMLEGAKLTIELTVISLLIGLCLAVPLALMRISKNPLIWMPVYVYVLFFRGTPLLVQIFMIYYGSGQFHDFLESVGLWFFFREAYFCALLSLTLNTAGYTAEILRGAIRGVPHGEVEAARAYGMSKFLLYRRIILPKAFRLAIPAYGNEVVFLMQATSLVSIISLVDLTFVARVAAIRTFKTYEIFLTAGAIYLVMTYGFLFFYRKLEHRLSGHLRERQEEVIALAAAEIIKSR